MTGERAAALELFNARLLAARSASALLQEWCGAAVRARKAAGGQPALTVAQRRRLQAGDDETLGYRAVSLACGPTVLSNAEAWYRSGFLTEDMQRTLAETETPFGLVVEPLTRHRRTFAVRPLPQPFLVEHQALLLTGDGQPFCIVRECYMAAVLDVLLKECR